MGPFTGDGLYLIDNLATVPTGIGGRQVKSIKEIMRASAELNAEGVHIGGSDRESNHSYGDAYESLFPDRSAIKLVMEVGVADGSCLLAWRDIFPNALIVGMDIHPSDKAHGERIEFHLGDQRSKDDCERAAAGRHFDLIVDDATHLIVDTLLTLYWLWPSVKPGGLYVVEEWPSPDPARIKSLWPQVEIVKTIGPSGGEEPLVVFRKPTPNRSY